MAIVTVRVIRSFSHRTCRNVVIQDVDLQNTTVRQLIDRAFAQMSANSLARLLLTGTPLPYPDYYDTIKIYMQPFGAKPNNTIINVGREDELVLHDWDKCLPECDVQHETELSLYNSGDYVAYLADPTPKWAT